MTALTLLLRYWREAALAVVLLALVDVCHARDRALVARGHAEALAAARADSLRRSDSTIAVRDAGHRADSARYAALEVARDSTATVARAALARWRAAVATTGLAARDTTTAPGTDSGSAVPGLAPSAPGIVAAGNDLAAACSLVIRDCDAERAGAHATITALTAQVEAWRERAQLLEHAAAVPVARPSRTRWFTAGAALGRASCYAAPPRPFP